MGELWELLCSAQENIGGIPAKFVEQKKEEIKKRQVCSFLFKANNFTTENWVIPNMYWTSRP